MKRGRVELSKRTKEFPLYTGKGWLGRINQENIQQKSNSRNQKITYQYTQENFPVFGISGEATVTVTKQSRTAGVDNSVFRKWGWGLAGPCRLRDFL